jgi:hypothetical protein
MSRSARVAEELWSSSLNGVRVFERGKFALLPEPARLYLEHAIAPGDAARQRCSPAHARRN